MIQLLVSQKQFLKDLRKLSDLVDNGVVKSTKFNTPKTKVNNLDKKIPNATTLFHINQCSTDKQSLQKEY